MRQTPSTYLHQLEAEILHDDGKLEEAPSRIGRFLSASAFSIPDFIVSRLGWSMPLSHFG